MPLASIGVDVITGFPGEDDDAFAETYEFLQSLPVSYLHVFTYSERAKTTAVRMEDSVPVHIRKERTKILRTLSLKKQRAHYERFIGVPREVLFEDSTEDGLRFGYTPEYVRVGVDESTVAANEIAEIKLTTIQASGFMLGLHASSSI
jgi:threonylcarbamoyladenosine tRNA methylthiotransferase MtaB